MEITKSQFDEWLLHPVTKEVFTVLKERQGKICVLMGTGKTLSNNQEETQRLTAECVGRFQEIADLLNIQFEDIIE